MKPSNTPENVLVRIKEILSLKLGLTPAKLKLMVDKFVRENMQTSGSKTHYTRVNTYNEFTTDRMTIKVFFKFLRIIDIQSVEFSVKVRTKTGKEVMKNMRKQYGEKKGKQVFYASINKGVAGSKKCLFAFLS